MASKTINDLGAGVATYSMNRQSQRVLVHVRTDDGDDETVDLERAEIIAALDDAAAFVAELDRLYAAALVKAGFA